MYGNPDEALHFFKENSKHLVQVMKMTRCLSDPCVFVKRDDNGTTILLMVLHVDDSYLTGTADAIAWFKVEVGKCFKFTEQGEVTKHLGVWYTWHIDEFGDKYVVLTMPKLIDEIVECYTKMTGHEPKKVGTPGTPGLILPKNVGETINHKGYMKIVGKIQYLVTKLMVEGANSARELAKHFSNPGEIHWKEVE